MTSHPLRTIASGCRRHIPILAELTIDPAQWYDLQRLNADNEDTHIVGHDDPGDGMMTVYLACSSDEVKRRLEAGWG